MKETDLSITLADGDTVSAILSLPGQGPSSAASGDTGIVIAHGAANDMNHELIRAFAQGMALKGFPCLRFNFPYRENQKKSIDPAHRLIHAWAMALECLKAEAGCTRTVAAGKSLGARMAAQGTASAAISPQGLIFLGYPLHAPGKKESLRDTPLYDIRVPMLFFEGTRDPFCDLEQFRNVYDRITVPKALTIVENGDHGFGLPKSDPRPAQEIFQTLVDQSGAWLLEIGLT